MSREQVVFVRLDVGDHFYIASPNGMSFWQIEDDGSLRELAREAQPEAQWTSPPTRDTRLEDIGPTLGVRMYNILRREGFETIGDVVFAWETNGRSWFATRRGVQSKDLRLLTTQVLAWQRFTREEGYVDG